jgi:hypothetical protein
MARTQRKADVQKSERDMHAAALRDAEGASIATLESDGPVASASPDETRDEKAQKQFTIFVRVTKKAKDLIAKYGTDKAVIDKLIEQFDAMSPEDRVALVEGGATFQRVGDLLADESWANHYFARGHWAAAAVSYHRLAANLTLSHQHCAFAQYREAYALNEFGLDLRAAGIEQCAKGRNDVDAYFGTCRDWLRRSAQLFESSMPVVGFPAQYCAACCYSILAQLVVESRLNSRLAAKLADEVTLRDRGDVGVSTWTKEIGPKWRAVLAGAKSTREKFFQKERQFDQFDADKYADQAFDLLERVHVDISEDGPQPERDFFRRFARNDVDLLFLHTDSKYRKRFEKWLGSGSENWLLETSRKLTDVYKEQTDVPIIQRRFSD